jgi:hypothetical protein
VVVVGESAPLRSHSRAGGASARAGPAMSEMAFSDSDGAPPEFDLLSLESFYRMSLSSMGDDDGRAAKAVGSGPNSAGGSSSGWAPRVGSGPDSGHMRSSDGSFEQLLRDRSGCTSLWPSHPALYVPDAHADGRS